MNVYQQPEDIYLTLFEVVQLSGIFQDSKTFVDALPKRDPMGILEDFYKEMRQGGFELERFVHENFTIPQDYSFPENQDNLISQLESKLKEHWPFLTREDDVHEKDSSIIYLPHPYVVPGGRFRELNYWDSYFTMIGLRVSDELELIESMVKNFAHLINKVGHIPQGNRTYLISRSQPPFFSKMVELLAEIKGTNDPYEEYWQEMLMEYIYWSEGLADLKLPGKFYKRVIRLDEDIIMNRYFDNETEPRPEAYAEDIELAEKTNRYPEKVFRNLRAACESGWDFSSRWLYRPDDLTSIQTTSIVPIELNVLITELERMLLKRSNHPGENTFFMNNVLKNRNNRIEAIDRYFWNEEKGIYLDFHIKFKEQIDRPSLAMLYPLWAGIARDEQAERVLDFVEKNFLKPGGLVTTLYDSGQQWDAPNGWAPLQWIGFEAMLKYDRPDMARTLAERWTGLVEAMYGKTGKLMDRYNVENVNLDPLKGEYDVQEGFGWTNGVYLAMKKWLKENN